MDSVKHEEVTIIDKDDTSNTVCHVVDGFLLEESNEPFPVSLYMFRFVYTRNYACHYMFILLFLLSKRWY